MRIIGRNQLLGVINKFRFNLQYWKNASKYNAAFEASLTEIKSQFKSRNEIYRFMNYLFNFGLNKEIKAHRSYFSLESRGFGEDALHAMWWILFREFKPKTCLEIGVYRGQVISLWALLAKINNQDINISGISPFSSAGDGVSEYLQSLDYQQDVKKNYAKYSDLTPKLFQGFSNDDASIKFIESETWDLIYIDGSHDYEVALSDYEVCKKVLPVGGLLILDDSSLYTDYNPQKFAFAGHPGPSKIVLENAMKEMDFIIGVGHNNVFRKR
ncbi:class I SAM-dependent methyltransferase [Aquirufa regiilacus]